MRGKPEEDGEWGKGREKGMRGKPGGGGRWQRNRRGGVGADTIGRTDVRDEHVLEVSGLTPDFTVEVQTSRSNATLFQHHLQRQSVGLSVIDLSVTAKFRMFPCLV